MFQGQIFVPRLSTVASQKSVPIVTPSMVDRVPKSSASNNTFGLFLNDAHLIAPFEEARFRLENKAVGMSIGLGTQVLIAGGLTVQANGTGVLADGAGTLTLRSAQANPSTITGNGTDMRLVSSSKNPKS
jgi:hypothetical protein